MLDWILRIEALMKAQQNFYTIMACLHSNITNDTVHFILIYKSMLSFFRGPASKLIVKFCLALWCAVTGAMFVFPGIRTAKMHWDCLR